MCFHCKEAIKKSLLLYFNIALYLNGVKGFDRPDDVTVKAAAEWRKGSEYGNKIAGYIEYSLIDGRHLESPNEKTIISMG